MNNPKTIEPTNQDFRSKLYQIQDMLVQGVQEIPADKSDKPINEKMENYYDLRRKWIDHSMEEIITLIDEGVPKFDVDEILKEASSKTKSDNDLVHIAWLIQGLDIWHKSGGKVGHSLEKCQRYVLNRITNLRIKGE